jgi:hypothetical protein
MQIILSLPSLPICMHGRFSWSIFPAKESKKKKEKKKYAYGF